jgi:hypothetical protein
MNKVFLFFIFLCSSILYSQNTNSSLNKVKFEDDSLKLSTIFFENKTFSFDYKKQEKTFSIYNPKPGLNTFNIVSRNYYSMENTNRLLGNEMKNLEKETIYPEVKKVTLGEAIFSGIIDSLFDR